MGKKVNPIGFRVGQRVALDPKFSWKSRWFANDNDYRRLLIEDLKIRKYLHSTLKQAAIGMIEIERMVKKIVVTIHSARPGVVIGKKGSDIEQIKKRLKFMTKCEIILNIVEIRKPELDATLIAESVAQQIEKRIAFRRAMKRSIQSCMRLGAKGIRINCAGRLGGAEIARTEWYKEGTVPLHTLRAIIDYGTASAQTTYGIIGIKVWVYKGESSKGE